MVKAILGALNKEKAIVATFSGNCQTSRRFVASSSDDVATHLGVRLRVLHAAGDGGAAVTRAPCSTAAGSPLYTLQLYLQHGDYVYGHIAANMSTRLYLKITIALC